MFRFISILLAGIAGAALLHLIIILALPSYSDRDAYSRVVRATGTDNRFVSLSDKPDQGGLANDDPYLKGAVCSFSVRDTPLRLSASGSVPFWSIGVFDPQSNEIFSMSDRTAVNGQLDVILGSDVQLAAIRKGQPQLAARSILVENPSVSGYVVLRVLSPTPSYGDIAQKFLEQANCAPFDGG